MRRGWPPGDFRATLRLNSGRMQFLGGSGVRKRWCLATLVYELRHFTSD